MTVKEQSLASEISLVQDVYLGLQDVVRSGLDNTFAAQAASGRDFGSQVYEDHKKVQDEDAFYKRREAYKEELSKYDDQISKVETRGEKVSIWVRKQGFKIFKHPNFKKALAYTAIGVAVGVGIGALIVATGGIGILPATGALAAIGPALPVVAGIAGGLVVAPFFIEGRVGAALQTIAVIAVATLSIALFAGVGGIAAVHIGVTAGIAGISTGVGYVVSFGSKRKKFSMGTIFSLARK